MALSLEDKRRLVEEVSSLSANSFSVIAAKYVGLNVAQMTQLRNLARGSDVKVKVVKNTLAKRALSETKFKSLEDVLTGQTVLLFGGEELGSAAKVAKNFSKEFEKFEVYGLTLGDGFLPASELLAVASLPTYDEALSKLLYVLKAPIQKFATTLNEVPSKLVRTVSAIKDTK